MKQTAYLSREDLIRLLKTRQGGMNQLELAEHIGVSKSLIGMILGGTRDPGKDVLDFLGMEAVTLYRRKQKNGTR